MTTTPAPTEPIAPVIIDSPILAGPTKTERMGVVLAVDLGSQDLALAVSRENRMPRASVVVTTAARTIIRLSKAGEKIEGLVVHGSELDATMHPEFTEIVGNLRDLRNKWFAKAKLWLWSHDAHLDDPNTLRSLGVFDRVCVRMEAGTAKTFASLTQRKTAEHATLLTKLAGVDHLVIAARFVRGDVDNSTDAEVKAWIKRLTELKPREVYLLNSDAKSSGARKLRPVPKSRLNEIAEEIQSKLGIQAVVHSGESLLG